MTILDVFQNRLNLSDSESKSLMAEFSQAEDEASLHFALSNRYEMILPMSGSWLINGKYYYIKCCFVFKESNLHGVDFIELKKITADEYANHQIDVVMNERLSPSNN